VGSQCPPGPGASVSATDTRPPDIEITQPTNGGYACCKVKLGAHALDNLGVTSIQFKVDGSPVGSLVTQDPYSTVWDATGVPLGQHTVTAVATDAAGNQGTSPGVIVNLSQMDVQAENGGGSNVRGKPDSGDTITYTFGRPVNPNTVVLGWSGVKPSSCAAPAPPGCVTVAIEANNRFDVNDTDAITVWKDPQRTGVDPLNPKLTALGSVDLAVDTYVGATTSFLRSPMELVNGGTAVRITLGEGATNASVHNELGSMKWYASSEVRDTTNAPFCVACKVFESIVPWVDPIGGGTIVDDDREF
jgi:hypothetical protein